MSYEPRRYWEERGIGYLHESHEGDAERRNWIKKIVDELKPDSVLEVGCGPGKNFSAFCHVKDPHAVDFSASAIASIPDKMGVNVEWMDAKDLRDFPDRRFDLSCTCECFLHIPHAENQIDRAVNEICRVTNKHLLLLELWDPDFTLPHLAAWCFKHNYPDLIKPHGFVEVDRRQLSANTGLFLFRRKET